MKGEHPSAEQLQLCYDGELPAREAAELRLHLAGCKPCQAYMSQLERLGQFVKLATTDAQASVAQPDFDRAFGSIARALSLDQGQGQEQVAATRSSAQPAVHAPRASSWRAKARRRWLHRGAPALGAAALAAAVLLMVFRHDSASLSGEAPDAPVHEAGVLMGHSEVVDVDFGSNAGQVFAIPLNDGSSIPVVWIDDDDDDEE